MVKQPLKITVFIQMKKTFKQNFDLEWPLCAEYKYI